MHFRLHRPDFEALAQVAHLRHAGGDDAAHQHVPGRRAVVWVGDPLEGIKEAIRHK